MTASNRAGLFQWRNRERGEGAQLGGSRHVRAALAHGDEYGLRALPHGLCAWLFPLPL